MAAVRVVVVHVALRMEPAAVVAVLLVIVVVLVALCYKWTTAVSARRVCVLLFWTRRWRLRALSSPDAATDRPRCLILCQVGDVVVVMPLPFTLSVRKRVTSKFCGRDQ